MILKIPTCEHCGSNKYTSLSYGDDNYSMRCRICRSESKGEFTKIETNYPTVVFDDGLIVRELNSEKEIFYDEETGFPFGVNVEVFTHDFSNRSDFEVFNITEFHYLFDSIIGDEQIALESDLHGHGGTRPLNAIKFISITKAKEMEDSYYG